MVIMFDKFLRRLKKQKSPCPCQDGGGNPSGASSTRSATHFLSKLVIHGGDIASRLVEHDINTLVLAVNDFFTAYRDNVAFGTNLVADMSGWLLTFTFPPRSINSSALRRNKIRIRTDIFEVVWVRFSYYSHFTLKLCFCSHDVSSAV